MGRKQSPWGASLEDRIAHTLAQEPDAGGPTTSSSDRSGQGGHTFPRHVSVNTIGRSDDRHPGVLMDWCRDRGEWHALVTWVEGGGMRPAHAHTAWLRTEHVTPA